MIPIESIHQPGSVEEALQLLAGLPNPKVLAGGSDLMPQLHRDAHIEALRHRHPKPWMNQSVQIVDISRLQALKMFRTENGKCRMGPLLTHAELSSHPAVRNHVPFLASAAGQIGSLQIRNQGTVGGNICNASPCADTVPPLVCLEAEITLQSQRKTRTVPLVSFFIDAQKTILARDELLIEICFSLPAEKNLQFYRKLGQRRGASIAKLSLAFLAGYRNGHLHRVRIAMGAVGPTVIVAHRTEEFLEGKAVSRGILREAKALCQQEAKPIDDLRSTREYRAAMVGELLEIGLEELL